MLWDAWTEGGPAGVQQVMAQEQPWDAAAQAAAAASRSTRPVLVRPPVSAFGGGFVTTPEHEQEVAAAAMAATGLPTGDRAGGMGGDPGHLRRVLVHASGYVQSPYADLKPPGDDTRDTRRMLAAEDDPATGDRRRGALAPGKPSRNPPRKLWHASPGSSGR